MKIRQITQATIRAPSRIAAASVTLIDGPPYDGKYSVTPSVEVQQLNTKDKHMKDNMTIEPIPYYTTTNLSGGYTAIIGE